MEKLKISLIAYPGAPDYIFNEGKKNVHEIMHNGNIKETNEQPDVIFVLTGGSEGQAKQMIQNQKFLLLVATSANNSYAAATEIKSYADAHGIPNILINTDFDDLEFYLSNSVKLKNVFAKLRNYKLGLVGNVSNWLINSDVDKKLLKKKLGIEVMHLDWPTHKEVFTYPVNPVFINHFSSSSDYDLEDSSKVFTMLHEVVDKHKLDAITVECFPLVKKHKVTACLALAKLMSDGIPAGCEGDITSIVGMILVHELLGMIPWMANLVAVNASDVIFAHCTINTKLVSNYAINTHFESNEGTAIQGKFKAKEATIFRLNNKLDRAFVSHGKVSEMPFREDACRTQTKIEIPGQDAVLLKEKPLGNHHIIIPGNHVAFLIFLMKMLEIELVKN